MKIKNEIITAPGGWWKNGAGFFGKNYILGDNSIEGYLPGGSETLGQRTMRESEGIDNIVKAQFPDKQRISLIDFACGYGRHAMALSGKGYGVTGIDINDEHLRKAEELAAGKNEAPIFLKKDMRSIGPELHGKFDIAINMFYSFGFFHEEKENVAAMQEFYNSLNERGLLIMHSDVSPEIISGGGYMFSEERSLAGGGKLLINERYDNNSKRVTGTWTIVGANGQETLTPYSMRIYSFPELREMAERCGFRSSYSRGSFSGENFTPQSHELVFVASK